MPQSLLRPDNRAIALGAALVLFAAVLFLPQVLNDGDTYWHIAAGRWMIENRAVLRIDPFSRFFAGHPWQAHEWLAEILMALAYVGAGWSGLVLLFAAAAGLTAFLLARHLGRSLHGLALVVTLILAMASIAGNLLARPHLLALPLLELWTAGLLFARDENRAPSWFLLPVMLLWVNLHASFLIGFVLLAAFALEAAADAPAGGRLAQLRKWSAFAGAAVLAALVNPHGVTAFLFPLRLMATPALALVSEWQPTDFGALPPFVFAVAAALYVLLSRGIRVRPVRIVLLLALLWLAAAHARHQMLIAIVGPLLLAGPIGTALGGEAPAMRRNGWVVAGFASLFLVLMGARLAIPLVRTDGITTPKTALAHVPQALAREPVLNAYAYGGYLIFNHIPPFIDGRVELYGQRFLANDEAIERGDAAALAATLARYHIRWTIFPADSWAAARMDHLSGWRRLYADRWAVVHVPDAPP